MKKRARKDHLVHYVTKQDCRIVLNRVPAELKIRLRDVFVHYRGRGTRRLGWVTTRGRRDINLIAWLPPRASLGKYVGHSAPYATLFGAPARGQWPPWAIRRFMLYDVLLHELGHLQVIEPNGSKNKTKFASESRAQCFANRVRGTLWRSRFSHPDPVHNPPLEDELAFIPVWERLDKERRRELVEMVLAAPRLVTNTYLEDRFGPLTKTQQAFLRRALCQGRTFLRRTVPAIPKSFARFIITERRAPAEGGERASSRLKDQGCQGASKPPTGIPVRRSATVLRTGRATTRAGSSEG